VNRVPAAALWCFLGSTLLAQEVRQLHPGRVLDAQGGPVAAAEVTFVSAPRLGAAFGDDDVVVGHSGNDGRFRVELIPGRHYQAWAAQRRGEQVLTSPLRPMQGPQTMLKLGEKLRPAMTKWDVQGADRWREHGTLTVHVLVAGSCRVVSEAVVDDEGFAAVPTLPGATFVARVFSRDRLVFVARDVVPEAGIRLPPPYLVPVHVVDSRDQPQNEAEIVRRWGTWTVAQGPVAGIPQHEEWPMAISGEDGKAEVLVAVDAMKLFMGNFITELQLVARHPTGGVGGVGKVSRGVCELKLYAEPGTQALVARRAPDARGGVRCEDVDASRSLGTTRTIDEAGHFLLPRDRIRRDGEPRLVWIADVAPMVPVNDPFASVASRHPLLVLDDDLLDEDGVNLANLSVLRVQVLEASGAPAIGASVYCAPSVRGRFVDPSRSMWRVADASGRIALAVWPGTWCIGCAGDRQIGHQVVEVGRALPVITMQLRALENVRVRVVDRAGEPVPRAYITFAGSNAVVGGSPEANWAVAFATSLLAANGELVSDANGKAELAVPHAEVLAAGHFRYTLAVTCGARHATVMLDAAAKGVEIVLK
jgi:hypothetical protein